MEPWSVKAGIGPFWIELRLKMKQIESWSLRVAVGCFVKELLLKMKQIELWSVRVGMKEIRGCNA